MAKPIVLRNIKSPDDVKRALDAERNMLKRFIDYIKSQIESADESPEKDWLNVWLEDLEDNGKLNDEWRKLLDEGNDAKLGDRTRAETEMLEMFINTAEDQKADYISKNPDDVNVLVFDTWIEDFESDKAAADAVAKALGR